MGMDRFDNGGEPTLVERIADVLVHVLWLPGRLLLTTPNAHNNFLEWSLLFGNSLLWGFGRMITLKYAHRGFSLRTLLIATTLIAVVLGLVVWSSS